MGILVNESQIGGGGPSNTSRNIGDIFYTTRTDNSLNGAVECNGSQYNFSDFDSNLQSLFDDGKLPYIPIGEFDEMVTNQGGCDSFGYGTNELIIYPVTYMFGSTPRTLCYTNITNWYEVERDYYDKLLNVKVYDKDTHEELVGYYLKYIPETDCFYVYNNSDENMYGADSVYPERDGEPITLPTGGEFQATTYFKVPKKLSRVLVRTQKPTEDNNYTWFNLYSDGWCEQGGRVNATNGRSGYTVTLLIEMNNLNYNAITSLANSSYSTTGMAAVPKTSTTINLYNDQSGGRLMTWQVIGYANSVEYTKDKWNYQNVQVERPMIQLFNSTTDTAVATCNQVLADVSALNQGDYVIETQLPTEDNNYSWYRLYKSGWVEQGKFRNMMDAGANVTCMLIIPMKDTNYFVTGVYDTNTTAISSLSRIGVGTKTTQSFQMRTEGGQYSWEVKGFSNITN